MTDSLQQRPTVILVTGTMNAGGTESLIMEMLRQASGRIRYILLIHYEGSIKQGVFDSEITNLGYEMHYIKSPGSNGIKNYICEFSKFVHQIGHIDIVHSHLNGSGGIISLAAKKAGIPHRICHCHADIHFTGSLLNRLKNKIQLTAMMWLIELYATERWACSDSAWHRLFMPWHKKTIINNLINTRKYLSSEALRKSAKAKFNLTDKYIIGAVGRVAPIKNYECILRSIQNIDAHFVCFGRFDCENSYCKKLLHLAKELGIENRVHWMGNSNNISEDIHCIDLFVMPSFTEGFGMAAIESQAASIPALLSSGVPTIVDVDLGLVKFLNPEDTSSWQKQIKKQYLSHIVKIISPQKIISSFEQKNFDAPSAIKDIENLFITISNK